MRLFIPKVSCRFFKWMCRSVGAFLFLLLLSFPASGQSRALPVLEINPDARASAMGGNLYGEALGMVAYANPTTILYSPLPGEVSFGTQFYPSAEGVGRQQFYGVSVARRLGNGDHGVYAGFRHLGGYSIPLEGNGKLKPADWTVDAGYALRLSGDFSLTAGISFIHSKVVASANTVAFCAAAYYRNGLGMDQGRGAYIVGVDVAGLGPELDYGRAYRKTKLPVHFGGGGELVAELNELHRLAVSLGTRYYCSPKSSALFTGSVGAEYTFLRFVSVRGGYTCAEHDFSRVSFGGGVSLGNIHVDVAHQRGLGGNEVNTTLISLGLAL